MEESLKNYGWLINVAILIACAWLLAGLVASYFSLRWAGSGASSARSPAVAKDSPTVLSEIRGGKEAILDRNLFGKILVDPEENPLPDSVFVGGNQPAVKSELSYRLLGTVLTPDPAKSIATVMIERTSHRYHVGELLEKKHEIRTIDRGRIEFVNKDSRRLEYLGFPESTTTARGIGRGAVAGLPAQGIAQTSSNEFVISQSEWEKAMSNLDQILTQARAVPNFVDGKTQGFRVFAIRPGSIYQKLGIQNGDVLDAVNGSAIDSVNKAMTIFDTLKNEKNFEIQLRRAGAPQSFKYAIR